MKNTRESRVVARVLHILSVLLQQWTSTMLTKLRASQSKYVLYDVPPRVHEPQQDSNHACHLRAGPMLESRESPRELPHQERRGRDEQCSFEFESNGRVRPRENTRNNQRDM